MITKIATCLLTITLLAACETTTTTRTTNSKKKTATSGLYANNNDAPSVGDDSAEPAPPAEGPEDVPAEGPNDVRHNPALVPSPLLRDIAASHP